MVKISSRILQNEQPRHFVSLINWPTSILVKCRWCTKVTKLIEVLNMLDLQSSKQWRELTYTLDAWIVCMRSTQAAGRSCTHLTSAFFISASTETFRFQASNPAHIMIHDSHSFIILIVFHDVHNNHYLNNIMTWIIQIMKASYLIH